MGFLKLALAVVATLLILIVAALLFKGSSSPDAGTSSASEPVSRVVVDAEQPLSGSRVSVQSTTVITTDPTVRQLHATVLQVSENPKTRRQAARQLAELGSLEALEALKVILRQGSGRVRTAVAEALGKCPHPDGHKLLLGLVADSDEAVARGAVRGLSFKGGPDVAATLGELMLSAGTPESVRTEAALALGDVADPSALELLARAALDLRDETLVDHVLQGLARRPFAETEGIFREYLGTADLPQESKISALESIGSAQGKTASLLLEFATDPDPDLREAAAWGLIEAEPQDNLAPRLLQVLSGENEPDVRERLYLALANQEGVEELDILKLVAAETAPQARSAALALAAVACARSPTPDLLAFVNDTAVPELKTTALSSPSQQDRMSSVMTIARVRTPEAIAALNEVVRQSSDPKVLAAATAALKTKSRTAGP